MDNKLICFFQGTLLKTIIVFSIVYAFIILGVCAILTVNYMNIMIWLALGTGGLGILCVVFCCFLLGFHIMGAVKTASGFSNIQLKETNQSVKNFTEALKTLRSGEKYRLLYGIMVLLLCFVLNGWLIKFLAVYSGAVCWSSIMRIVVCNELIKKADSEQINIKIMTAGLITELLYTVILSVLGIFLLHHSNFGNVLICIGGFIIVYHLMIAVLNLKLIKQFRNTKEKHICST